MKKVNISIWLMLLGLGLSWNLHSQTITIGSGAKITVVGDGTTHLDTDGSLDVQGVLELISNSKLSIGGNFTIAQSTGFSQGSSTVVFDGTGSLQLITGAGPTTAELFHNLVVNSTAGVSLTSGSVERFFINNILTPQNGTLFTNNELGIRNTATIKGRVAYGAGTINGTVRVAKYLNSDKEEWRQLSLPIVFPINNSTNWNAFTNRISVLLNGYIPQNRINTFVWDATDADGTGGSDMALGWRYATNTDDETKAFNVFMSKNNSFHTFGASGQDFEVDGELNQGNFNFNLEYTRDPADVSATNAAAIGWNFVPNPWPAYVDAATMLADNTNFTSAYKAIHVWDATNPDDNAGQYRAILANGQSKEDYGTAGANIVDATQNLDVFQAFWVKATAPGQVCNLVASTMHTTTFKGERFLKQSFPTVRLDVFDRDSLWDQLVLYFNEATSRQFDLVGDAYFLPSIRKDAPRFYALEGNSKASIVGRPVDVTDSVQVVFGSSKNQSKFYIHADLDELEEGWFVYLRDKKDNQTYALEDKKSLAFNHYGGLNSERFVVYYTKQANAFAHLVSGEDARILPFVRNNQLVLQSFGISGAAQINAFDAIGRLVYSENTNLDLGEERVLDFPPSEKLLFIQVNIGGNSFVEKVYF